MSTIFLYHAKFRVWDGSAYSCLPIRIFDSTLRMSMLRATRVLKSLIGSPMAGFWVNSNASINDTIVGLKIVKQMIVSFFSNGVPDTLGGLDNCIIAHSVVFFPRKSDRHSVLGARASLRHFFANSDLCFLSFFSRFRFLFTSESR